MNQQAFEAGRDAYRQGDFATAVRWLEQAKMPGEVSGRIDHLLGNCLMKLGNYDAAATAYGDALADTSYGHSGALACNRGRALLAANKPQEAVASLVMATKDASYATPYKAYIALGNAYSQIGDYREAGVAYRSAAIDENNPDPAGALRSLGGCFMKMGRAVDAVEAYRTALDFSTPLESQNAIYEDLGIAYAAASRWNEALDSFAHATEDGTHQLSSEGELALAAAKSALTSASGGVSGGTDAFLAAAGYGTGADPLDPLGKSGEFMPSPDDTGFFDISEQEMARLDMENRNIKRKHKGGHLRGCLTFLLLMALILGGLGWAYVSGYGFPTQERVAEDLITKSSAGEDISGLLAGSVDDVKKVELEAILPTGATDVKVEGVDRSMNDSKAIVKATLSAGGEQNYEISMVRDGIGWKVNDVTVEYLALEGQAPKLETPAATNTTSGSQSTTQDTEKKEEEKKDEEKKDEESDEESSESESNSESESSSESSSESQSDTGDTGDASSTSDVVTE